jgi:hypothetical protein
MPAGQTGAYGAQPANPYGPQSVGGAASGPASYVPPAAASSGRVQPAGYVDAGRAAPYAEPGQRTVDSGYSNQRSVESGYVAPVGYGGDYPGYGTDFGPTGAGTDFGPNSFGTDFGPTGGDRRAAESGYMAPVARNSQDTGGRRRRAEGQPTWQDSWQQNGSTSGNHARPDLDSASGSHASGRSVSELLASNGGDAGTPHRRRRRED